MYIEVVGTGAAVVGTGSAVVGTGAASPSEGPKAAQPSLRSVADTVHNNQHWNTIVRSSCKDGEAWEGS